MKDKKIYQTVLLTGSSGMLGTSIYQELINHYKIYGVDITASNHIPPSDQFVGDLTDKSFLHNLLNNIKPEIIIHCAAIVNLKQCEEDKSVTDALHLDVTKELAAYSEARIVFISSDSVFDGEKGNYKETDSTNPVNYYGLSKLLGEEIVRENPDHLILRTNIIGFSIPLKNSITEWAIKSILNGESITGFEDVYFTPIYTKHLAKTLTGLLEKNIRGTLHVASSNRLSKYSFLKYLESRLINKSQYVEPVDSSTIKLHPQRPKDPTLNVSLLQEMIKAPTIEQGIDDLLEDYFSSSVKKGQYVEN